MRVVGKLLMSAFDPLRTSGMRPDASTWHLLHRRVMLARGEVPCMTQSVLLVFVTALLTWLIMKWARWTPDRPKRLSPQEREAERAKEIGTQLDGARDRASVVEIERNKLALAKAVKAALWVTEARLNLAVPELLKMGRLGAERTRLLGKKWTAPEGVTEIEGLDDPASPWAAWNFNGHHWRIEAQ